MPLTFNYTSPNFADLSLTYHLMSPTNDNPTATNRHPPATNNNPPATNRHLSLANEPRFLFAGNVYPTFGDIC